MAGNAGGGEGTRHAGASIGAAAAAAAAGSVDTRFNPPQQRRHRWGGFWGGLSCFRSQKRAKRIVPSSRIPDGNAAANRGNGPQPVGVSNQATTLTPSLLAPPSSPASFTNSALPSTAQSPSCFLSISANSPGGPSSTMYATGPYAHETQLVSPPVFSTFTTEPSTAPLTPPPELAHLTTPSSPDVPFAQYLSSSLDLKGSGKENGLPFVSTGYASGSDLRVTYPLYPESPSSSLISPMSGTPRTGMSSPFPEQEIPSQWDALASAQGSPYSRNQSWKLFGLDNSASKDFMLSPDSSFYPAASAQFYLDQAQQSYPSYSPSSGRLSFSREANAHPSGSRHSKACKQDVEEVEAYRASFGFSADELITTPHYVEISDPVDVSFTMSPFGNNNKPSMEQYPVTGMVFREAKDTSQSCLLNPEFSKSTSNEDTRWAGLKLPFLSGETSHSNSNQHAMTDEILLLKMRDLRVSKSFRSGLSSSDAEIDYRRSRSLKDPTTSF